MKILVIDVGATHVKLLATGQDDPREFESELGLTPEQLVVEVEQAAEGWDYEAVSIGYPGTVMGGRPVGEPFNLGPGWEGFPFEAAWHRPVKVINDTAMQALGSYDGGRLLFLSLGSSLSAAVIVDGVLEARELGHLPYKKATFEDYVGIRGLRRLGKKKWRNHVAEVVAQLAAALEPDSIVLGGDNVNRLKELPAGCREADNATAFVGGFRLWDAKVAQPALFPRHHPQRTERLEIKGA